MQFLIRPAVDCGRKYAFPAAWVAVFASGVALGEPLPSIDVAPYLSFAPAGKPSAISPDFPEFVVMNAVRIDQRHLAAGVSQQRCQGGAGHSGADDRYVDFGRASRGGGHVFAFLLVILRLPQSAVEISSGPISTSSNQRGWLVVTIVYVNDERFCFQRGAIAEPSMNSRPPASLSVCSLRPFHSAPGVKMVSTTCSMPFKSR